MERKNKNLMNKTACIALLLTCIYCSAWNLRKNIHLKMEKKRSQDLNRISTEFCKGEQVEVKKGKEEGKRRHQ
jgi:hypothetical protein